MVRLDRQALRGLEHRHARMDCQQFNQQTVMCGIEMLDDDKRQAGMGRQRAQQLAARFQTTCRSANRDNHGFVMGSRCLRRGLSGLAATRSPCGSQFRASG
jgi:hypothetical protein